MNFRKGIEVTCDPASKFNCSESNIELMYFRASAINQKCIDIFTIYRPPNGKIKYALDVVRYNVTEMVKVVGSKELIILGHLNIDLLDKRSYGAKKATELGHALNLTQIISDPTRVSRNTSSLIDVCYTNINHISESGTLSWTASDHLPIYLIKKRSLKYLKRKPHLLVGITPNWVQRRLKITYYHSP